MEYCDLLLGMYHKGRLTTKDLCVLCYWGRASGLTGPAVEFAVRPDSPTSHYQRHVDTVLGLGREDDNLYTLKLPATNKHSISSDVRDTPVAPIRILAR